MKKYTVKGVECRLMLRETGAFYSTSRIDNSNKAKELLKEELSGYDTENFVVMCLDNYKRPINIAYIAKGCINNVNVDLKSIFKVAFLSNALAIIVYHNHPDGDAYPSKEDIELTKRLKEACGILGICFLDHIIISSASETFSFADANMI